MIQGRVAQILSERELVINRGSAQGVKSGMRFEVLAATPTVIVDPDTRKEIGEVDRPKVRVEATIVQESLTICATYETKRVGGGLGVFDVSEMLTPARRVPTTLKLSEKPLPLDPDESYVKIGDRVRELVDPASD